MRCQCGVMRLGVVWDLRVVGDTLPRVLDAIRNEVSLAGSLRRSGLR